MEPGKANDGTTSYNVGLVRKDRPLKHSASDSELEKTVISMNPSDKKTAVRRVKFMDDSQTVVDNQGEVIWKGAATLPAITKGKYKQREGVLKNGEGTWPKKHTKTKEVKNTSKPGMLVVRASHPMGNPSGAELQTVAIVKGGQPLPAGVQDGSLKRVKYYKRNEAPQIPVSPDTRYTIIIPHKKSKPDGPGPLPKEPETPVTTESSKQPPLTFETFKPVEPPTDPRETKEESASEVEVPASDASFVVESKDGAAVAGETSLSKPVVEGKGLEPETEKGEMVEMQEKVPVKPRRTVPTADMPDPTSLGPPSPPSSGRVPKVITDYESSTFCKQFQHILVYLNIGLNEM